jgi:hypothetical protein
MLRISQASSCAAFLAMPLLLAACVSALPPVGTPSRMVSWKGQSYALRVVGNEPVAGVPGAYRTAVRIVAPDASVAGSVYAANCGAAAPGDITFDVKTGEYVVPGPCL